MKLEIDIVIPNRLINDIKVSGFNGESENGAWLMFSSSYIKQDIWSNSPRYRYILRKIFPLGSDDIESASPTHLTVKTDSFVPVIKEASEGFICGFLHGHPSGFRHFSDTDDENERALFKAVKNRNGENAKLISLLILPTGELRARCWNCLEEYNDCKITVTGSKFQKFEISHISSKTQTMFDRQIRLFGTSFSETLQNTNILIVGAGGTGSPLAIMLARAGIKNIAIIDPDKIEETNIHRLHGARIEDIGKSKAKSLANYINHIGFGDVAIGINGNVLQTEYQDLLKSADIIFVATDDHAGRMLLNRFAYFYETPVIDIGLATSKLSTGQIQDMSGRVTVLYPGTTCLICREIIDSQIAREEELKRRDPDAFHRQMKEGYILGGGEPEPAFISMTTSVATMAIEELIQMINAFRVKNANSAQRYRRFHIPEDRKMDEEPNPDCQNCGTSENWGIGDIIPFLDRVA